MEKIDWTKPLELLDGTPVVLSDPGDIDSEFGGAAPDKDGDYWIKREDGEDCLGFTNRCIGDGDGYVRNRSEPEA